MSMGLRAGELRHQILIQQATYATTGSGSKTIPEWVTQITCRAAIMPWKSDEIVKDDKLSLETLHRIRIYYQADITPDMRIVFGSRIFNIISILDPSERNVMIDFICREDDAIY